MMFTWHGVELDYFDHPYNTTRLNERAVEIPIVREWLPETGGGLEVGNVLSHYQATTHTVVDRYETMAPAQNVDLFDVYGQYDWVLAISTVEHVRWDPPEAQDPNGAVDAIFHLLARVRTGGKMLVTVPLGHHPHLDAYISSGALYASRDCVFARDGDGWVQHDRTMWKPYGATTKWAETVWIGEWNL